MEYKTKILLIANVNTIHIRKFLNELTLVSNNISIEVFNIGKSDSNEDQRILINSKFIVYDAKKRFPSKLYANRYFANILHLIDVYISILRLRRHYDLINIMPFTMISVFLMPLYKIFSNKIMISPWGSEVYRIPFFQKIAVKMLGYKYADYVSVPKGKFKEDIKYSFDISEHKFVDLGFGSDIIDEIANNQNISKEYSKGKLFLNANSFIITCGYNRSVMQQHYEIINALNEVKDLLPPQTILLFPMTYGRSNNTYIEEIEQKLQSYGMQCKIYTDFLSPKELLYLRKATDLFIHIQKTDAFSATVQEYILCKTTIINGGWLRYPTLEIDGLPYHLVNSVEELPLVLKRILLNEASKIEFSDNLMNYIQENGWSKAIKKWYDFYSNVNKVYDSEKATIVLSK